MRFDEVELEPVPLGIEDDVPALPLPSPTTGDAPRGKRLLALLTDLSLFAALTLALSPLLPQPYEWTHLAALAGFVVVVSYYYYVGTWLLWGKTIGGAIFDVRVVPRSSQALSLKDASIRWAAVYLSLASAGVGFALAALPSRLSLPDRVSNTRCVVG
jgi:uncharacterized RDD family membrane protein YckC